MAVAAALGGKPTLADWLARRLTCLESKVLLSLRRHIADWAVFWATIFVDEPDCSIAFACN
jgi:hypothetical protein